LSDQLGQAVVVENPPAQASNLAAEAAVRAPRRRLQVLARSHGERDQCELFKKFSFNVISDLAPMAGLVSFPNIMTVNASFPQKSVPEFIAYAKAQPWQAAGRHARTLE
jgi:tripartite-type tricarboxylate transporter receptor subunit TctC